MITRYTITPNRVQLTPYVPATAAGKWLDSVAATYDHPWRDRAAVVADYCAGRPTPGDVVTEEVIGVGSTVAVYDRWQSRGWDDGDTVTYAVARNAAGEWQEFHVATDRCDAGNRAVIDATTEAAEAYEAHLRAEAERIARERAEEAARAEAERIARERVSPEKGAFVIVAKGRKVPVGTVGRLFYTASSEYGMRAGIATSTRTEKRTGRNGTEYDSAADVVWTALDNLAVILPEMPADAREVDALYRCAAAVYAHAAARAEVDTDAEDYVRAGAVMDAFAALWAWASQARERFAVMLAWSPADLPRVDRDTPRTVEEVCECVETMPEVAHRAAQIAEAWVPDLADSTRALLASTLGVVYAPTKRARAPRKTPARATA